MNYVVVAEWSPWIATVVEQYAHPFATVAPGPLPNLLQRWLGRSFLGRSAVEFPHPILPSTSFAALQAGVRLGGKLVERVPYGSVLLQRRLLGAWAARQLARSKALTAGSSSECFAPTLAARELFALAKAKGLRTTLLVDLPIIDRLHRDLDAAFLRFPEEGSLCNFRAPAWAQARQRAEILLADRIIVRGPFAAAAISGFAPHRFIESMPPPQPVVDLTFAADAPLYLTGGANARSGLPLAVAVARHLGRTVVAVDSPATELHHHRMSSLRVLATPPARASCGLHFALCETYGRQRFPDGFPLVSIEPGAKHSVTELAALVEQQITSRTATSRVARDMASRTSCDADNQTYSQH